MTRFLLLAFVLLAGCATEGNGRVVQLDDASAASMLVPGQTTKAQVRAAFGEGTVVRFESGRETWHYVHRSGMAKGWDAVPYINLIAARVAGDEKELVVLFDASGVVLRWSLQVNPATRGKG